MQRQTPSQRLCFHFGHPYRLQRLAIAELTNRAYLIRALPGFATNKNLHHILCVFVYFLLPHSLHLLPDA